MTSMKQLFPEVEDLKRNLRAQLDTLTVQLTELKRQLESVETTCKLLKEQESGGKAFMQLAGSIFASDLKGLTQLEALTKIAKANNNRLKLITAKDLLLRAGVTKSRKNANNIIFNVIKRSELFKRVAPGEYELVQESSSQDDGAAALQ
jgi:hypothetical protein